MTESKTDKWHMDLQYLKDLVGREPVDVRIENKHVAVYFDNNMRILFKQW